MKPLLRIRTIRRIDPINISRGFRIDKCQLYMEERIEIATIWLKKGLSQLINKNAKIYRACQHKAKFHVFKQAITFNGTDEGVTQKKKLDDSINMISDKEDDQ